LIDGLFGTHRFVFHLWEGIPFLKGLYVFTISFIEVLSLLTFFVTIAFLWRRNLLSIPRFNMPEMKGWAKQDGNIILFLELTLVDQHFLDEYSRYGGS
jgi:hypothetical protein